MSELPPDPTEVAPEDLAVQHLGQYATVKWDDDRQYAIGTIVAVSADADSDLAHARRHRRADRLSAGDAGQPDACWSGFKTRTPLTPTSG